MPVTADYINELERRHGSSLYIDELRRRYAPNPMNEVDRIHSIASMSSELASETNWEIPDPQDIGYKGNEAERGFWGKIKESWGRGKQQALADVAITTALNNKNKLEYAISIKDRLLNDEVQDPIEANWLTDILYSNTRTAGQMWESIKAGGKGAIIVGGAGAGVGAIVGAITPTVGEEPAAIGGGAATGLKIGTKLGLAEGAALFSYRQGVGEMYYEMIKGGSDPEIADTIAHIGGIPYALIEVGQLKALAPDIKKNINKKLTKSLSKLILEYSKKYGKTWGTEVLEEMGQKVVSITAKDVADILSDNEIDIKKGYLRDRILEVLNEGKEAAKSMALLPLPGTAIEAGIQTVGTREANKTEEQKAIEIEKEPEFREEPQTAEEMIQKATRLQQLQALATIAPEAPVTPEVQEGIKPPVTPEKPAVEAAKPRGEVAEKRGEVVDTEIPTKPVVETKKSIQYPQNRYKDTSTEQKELLLKGLYEGDNNIIDNPENIKYYQELKESFTPEETKEFSSITGILDKQIAQLSTKTKEAKPEILGGEDPIIKITQALKEAKKVRPLTETKQKAERSKRVGAASAAMKRAVEKGEQVETSIFRSTGLLKGALTKYTELYESIRDKMEQSSPGTVDEAFKSIYNNPDLQYFDVINTAEAFRKLIDGESLTYREIDLIKNHFGLELGEIAETRVEKSSIFDRIYTLWRAGLLTGLKTWGPASINNLSNLIHGFTETVKDVPASLVDSVMSIFTGQRTSVFTHRGTMKGVKEGIVKGWNYLSTGMDERYIGQKYDYKKINFGESKFAKGLQVYEETIFHLMGAADQPYYYGAKARSLYNQALANGYNQGLKGKELRAHIDRLVQNPTDDMIKYAALDAEVSVFQNKTMLGDIAAKIQKIPFFRWFVPFARTPAAVAMQIVNYTPIGVTKEIASQIKNKNFDQRILSQSFGRSVFGTAALYLGGLLLREGLMTLAYPRGERERKLWELEGRKPFAIKIGDKWRSIYVLGPVGNVLAVGGYFEQELQESGSPSKAITVALAGGAKSWSEETFLRGMNQAVSAITDPERSFENWFSQQAGSAMPTIIVDIARAVDYTERRTEEPFERLVSRIPFAREELEPKLNVFGQDLPRYGGNPLEVMLDATRPFKVRQDVVVDELRRLWDNDVKVSPTLLGDRAGYEILTDEENTLLWRRAGEMVYRGVFTLINTPAYKFYDDEMKGKAIEKVVKDAKDYARAEAATNKIAQGITIEQLREDGLVTNDVLKYIDTLIAGR